MVRLVGRWTALQARVTPGDSIDIQLGPNAGGWSGVARGMDAASEEGCAVRHGDVEPPIIPGTGKRLTDTDLIVYGRIVARIRAAGLTVRRACCVAALVGTLALEACGQGQMPSSEWTATSARQRLIGASLQRVSLTTPVFRIGGAAAPGDSAFGYVNGVLLDRQNRMWVADRYVSAISRFDAQGRFIDRIGRKGRGPGEFLQVELVGWSGDAAAAWDADGHRLTLIPEDGGAPQTGGPGGGPRIMIGVSSSGTPVYTPVQRPTRPVPKIGWYTEDPVRVEAGPAAGDSASLLVVAPGLELYIDSAGTWPNPFGPSFSAAVYGDTLVVAGTTGADVLVRGLQAGTPIVLDCDSAPGVPFTDSLKALYREWQSRGPARAPPATAMASRDLPTRVPAFDAVVVSRNGVLWLRRWGSAWSNGPVPWEVISMGGDHLGTALLPRGERVVAANERRVVTMSFDEDKAAVLSEYEQPFRVRSGR